MTTTTSPKPSNTDRTVVADRKVVTTNDRNPWTNWVLAAVAALVIVVVGFFALGGDADLDIDNGNIDIEAPAADLDVEAPDIDVDLPSVDVDVESGDIDVEEADVEADASTDG